MTAKIAPNLGESFEIRVSRPATDEDIAILAPGDWISERDHPFSWQFKRWDGDMCIGTWEGKEFLVPRHLLTVCTVVDGQATKFYWAVKRGDIEFKVGDKVQHKVYFDGEGPQGIVVEVDNKAQSVKVKMDDGKVYSFNPETLKLRNKVSVDIAPENLIKSQDNGFEELIEQFDEAISGLSKDEVQVGDRFALKPGITNECNVTAIDGDKYHVIWGLNGYEQDVDRTFFDNLKAVKRIEVGDRLFSMHPYIKGEIVVAEYPCVDAAGEDWKFVVTAEANLIHLKFLSSIDSVSSPESTVKSQESLTEDDRWNPNHFGEVPHQIEADGQATIFYDTTGEPPEPEDFATIDEYEEAWQEWEQNQPVAPSQSEGFWRARFGLHPTIAPTREDDRFIRCDTLPVEEQIKLCQDRITQQRWRIDDLTKNCKAGQSKDNAVASAESAIASENSRIDELLEDLIIYRQFLDLGLEKDEAREMALAIIADQTPPP